MSPIRLVIFDLDGTLVHFPFEHLFSTAERVIEELSLPSVGRTEIERCFAAFTFFDLVAHHQRDIFSQELATQLHGMEYPVSEVFEDTIPVLKELKKAGLSLAVATARSTTVDLLQTQLGHTGMVPHFSAWAVRNSHEDDWQDKSSQILNVCRQLEVDPGQAVMVGDIPCDISSAKAVGIGKTVALTSGGIHREVLEKESPDFLCSCLTELLACGFLT